MEVSRWNTPAAFFAWPHVQSEINAIDAQGYRAAIELAQGLHGDRARPCPNCGRNPGELFWVCLTSPDETWRAGAGRVGFMTICKRCRAQVDFLVDQELTDLHAEECTAGGSPG